MTDPSPASDAPLVSVIIPTHNRRALLQRSVACVLRQSIGDLECIVVDDGSDDGTHEWLLSVTDPRLRAIRLQERAGAARARNQGIRAARGRYVAFLDSDDEWPHEYLAQLLPAFEQTPRPCTVWTGVLLVNNGRRTPMVPHVRADVFEELLNHDFPFSVIAIVVDRQMAGAALHFDESMPAHHDYDLLLTLASRFPVACVAEPLYVWHWHEGPRVSRAGRNAESRRKLIDKYALELGQRPVSAARQWFVLARTQRQIGDIDGVRESIARAAELDPTNRRVRVLAWASKRGRRSTVFAWRASHLFDKAFGRKA